MVVASDAKRRSVLADEGVAVSVGRIMVMRGADGLDVWWRRIGMPPSFSAVAVVALSVLMAVGCKSSQSARPVASSLWRPKADLAPACMVRAESQPREGGGKYFRMTS